MLPTTLTPKSQLTPEQLVYGRKQTPSVSITFVRLHAPEAVKLAERYERARERFLHVWEDGEFMFHPGMYAKVLKAKEALLAAIPEHLHTGYHEPKAVE